MAIVSRDLTDPTGHGGPRVILHPKVLIISPDEQRAESIEKHLEGTDFQVIQTPDVLSAMAMLKAEHVDIVLLDDNPREFFISDAARILKCMSRRDYLPVMCLFPKPVEASLRSEVLAAGADDYLMGDIEPIELQARLRRLLGIIALHDEFHRSKKELEDALSRELQLLRQLRSDNQQLKQRSVTDGLTSLYNHRYLMEWLKTEFKIARRYGHPISFVIADLDHFKQVNDTFGHPFGDFVLKELAVVAKSAARESDLVARYGGEEFAIVLPRSDREMARAFADRFHKAVAERSFEKGAHCVDLTISVGVATYPLDAEATSPEVLVYLADQALLQAKATGRNKVVAWHELDLDMRAQVRQQLSGRAMAAAASGGTLSSPFM